MPADEPQTDLAAAIPELGELRDRAAADAWPDVVDRLVGLLNRDENLLPIATGVVVRANSTMVREQADRHLDDLVAHTLWAHHLIVTGWAIRSAGFADQVSQQQFEDFHRHLRAAEQILIEVCAREPQWGLPWHLRLMTSRGLELGLSETRRRYQRLAEHHPDHYAGQHQMLQRLCPKWGGSWEDAFQFARSCAASASAGSPAPALVAMTHLEQWLALGEDAGGKHLRRPEVREELLTGSAASVFHPEFRPAFDWVSAHTLFGVVHALAGDAELAAPHFRALGDVVDALPWSYLGKSRSAVGRIRSRALSTAAAR